MMPLLSVRAKKTLEQPLQFALQVIRRFRANQGFLLAGALAYYSLLSIVPVIVVVLVLVSTIYDTQLLLATLHDYVVLVTPGKADEVLDQIRLFLDNRHLVGSMGLISMLVFSSFAFTVLENIMRVIFAHRDEAKNRPMLLSLVIPYIYISLLAVSLLVVTTVDGLLQAMDTNLSLFGHQWSVTNLEVLFINAITLLGECIMLTSFYLVMPVGRTKWRHALIGGIIAAILWEITRSVLVWYFSNWSPVNLVYGTFATTIVILLSLEFAAIILLMGAQIIAEYEQIPYPEPAASG